MFEYGNLHFSLHLECEAYSIGCAQCETDSEGGGLEQVTCLECNYNYFLITIDGKSHCTMDCAASGRSFKPNYLTQKCEGGAYFKLALI